VPPEQVSAVLVLHETQPAPPVPHALTFPTLQVAPAQQPDGQDDASQMQVPAAHRWPAAHKPPPLPHRQTPLSQRSALVPHATQAEPLVPHCEVVGEMQVLPLQQPDGHEAALQTQTPPTHR
jgi:hypothetical protein